MTGPACGHIAAITDRQAREAAGMRGVREDQAAMGTPSDVPGMRPTLCCDSSPNRHASKHARSAPSGDCVCGARRALALLLSG